jgi:UDP-N-acetylmuramoyl-tripeptide--D-alanyl-D-alanine ligase
MLMIPITVREFAKIVHATAVTGDDNNRAVTVSGVQVDTRKIQPGDAFVAFEGAQTDGHLFVNNAFDCGASVAIVGKPVKTDGGCVIQVEAPLTAIQALAKHERSTFTGPVVGVTGSNGKTTTKQMVAAVLGGAKSCLYTQGNFNNELGLPLTILQRTPAHRAMVLEMGMRGFGQIASLCDIAQPNIGIITNIGQSHIELLGSQAGIAKAKAELLAALPASGCAILNQDDDFLVQVAEQTKAPVIWYGLQSDADVHARDITWTKEGMRFTAVVFGQTQQMFLPTYGHHNILNALAATAVGHATDIPLPQISERLAALEELSGRLNILQGKDQTTIIDDCYNASPLSVTASLNVLAELAPENQRIAILGDMFELGWFAEQGHRQVGEHAAQVGVSRLMAVGDDARWIAEAARTGGVKDVIHAPTVETAISQLAAWIEPQTTVLVKASRGMHLERIVAALTTSEVGTAEK